VFTPDDRERLRTALVQAARSDGRISGAALTGSAAGGKEDRWSDVDLAFGVADGASLDDVLGDWTALMYRDQGALHHFDVQVGKWTYRVFLLVSTLQVDLAFVPEAEFGPRAPTFHVVFGAAVELPKPAAARAELLLGWGWLYALHARSSIQRGKQWSAEYMVSGLRDQVLAMACLRHGLPVSEAGGIDRLPVEVVRPLEAALVRSLERDELRRAFRVAMAGLLGEARYLDSDLAERLEPALQELAAG